MTKRQKRRLIKHLVGSWHLFEQTMGFGNPTAGGFKTMKEVLLAVGKLNKRLQDEIGETLAVSGHFFKEIAVPADHPLVGKYAKYNEPRAILLDEWIAGVQAGIYPEIGRIIPGGFGFPGSDFGHFISPDPERQQMAMDMLVYAFAESARVKAANAGLGEVIVWTGPDGLRWERMINGDDPILSYETVPQLEEWVLFQNNVVAAVKRARDLGYTDEKLLIEGKGAGDPCYLDFMVDTKLAVRMIKEINERVGADVAEWQGESAHERGCGITMPEAMGIAIEGGVFKGRFHFNAGGIASIRFSDLLEKGTRMSEFQQYVDPDFCPGQGPKEWVDDQRDTLRVAAEWGKETGNVVYVEADARYSRHADTIGQLYRSVIFTHEAFMEFAA